MVHCRTARIIRYMLTDIFAYRYAEVPMWDAFTDRDRKFIVQAYRIVEEQLFPPYSGKDKNEWTDPRWKLINDRLSTELGLQELTKRVGGYYFDYGGGKRWQSYTKPWHTVCKDFVCVDFPANASPDEFIKERLSFVEIAFRERENDVTEANKKLPQSILDWKIRMAKKRAQLQAIRGSDNDTSWIEDQNRDFNNKFRASVDELNTRLRQAGYKLNYHNGFIQISADEKVEQEIETPFWALVADPKWQNVDTDMKEAIDRRDGGDRDPSFYAAKALESTIKIISKEKGWSTGKESGAHNFIDNLVSKNNGRFIDVWESDSMKHFFTHVRNPLGHGPGGEPMPELNAQQTNWAIEFCMTWVKSLIERM